MHTSDHLTYSFGEFRLDLARGALFRGTVEVKLRPQSFDVLKFLVDNPGRLVSKNELIERVWNGMAVTDDSLVQCMKDIRRALGDDTQQTIKTVPRRGYLFDGDVSKNGGAIYKEETRGVHLVFEETVEGDVETHGRAEPRTISRRLGTAASLATALIVLAGVGSAGYVYFFRRPTPPFTSVTMKPLTTDGKATLAAISPDGKYVAFVSEEPPGERSVWVRQVAAINPTRIVPPARVGYEGVTFSPDASFIYFVRDRTLFQIPTLGGTEPRKILDDVGGEISFSPDGSRFAFVRLGDGKGSGTRVMIANTDGSGEPQVLARRTPPEVFRAGCAWSPDGERLACTGGDNQLFGQMYPVIVSVADGSTTTMTSRQWNHIGQKQWIADGSGFVMDAVGNAGVGPQLWYVSYPAGDARQVYSNPNGYRHPSMTADSHYLVAIELNDRINMQSIDIAAPEKEPVKLSSGTIGTENVNTTTPDGRILFDSETDGDRDLWIMNADGTGRQQLTFGPPMEGDANLSRDNRQIAFARASQGIWIMDVDGGNKRQLAEFGMFPEYSPDGKWVYYTLPRERWSLRKVSIDGGESVRVTEHPAVQPAVSPDGRLLAYMHFVNRNDAELYVVVAETMEIIKKFPATPRAQFEIEWAPDGSAIAYNATMDGVDKIVRQPFEGGIPQVIVAAASESEKIGGFTFSRDGRRLFYSVGPIHQNVVLFTLER